MNGPYLIEGGIFNDARGTLKFVNDFSLEGVKRFYTITQSPGSGPRAWQGHKTEAKYFYCLKGSFAVRLVKVDNWDMPGENPEIVSFELSGQKSEILAVPGGYANGIKALEDDSQLLVFSERSLEEAKGDEQRFDTHLWVNWDKV